MLVNVLAERREPMMSVVDRLRLLIEPLLVDNGLELFDVEYAGGRVVVLVDRPGGIDLDALTRATHRISAALDEHDPIPGGRYLLEVSSPGLERALRTPAHFRRYVGSTVAVKTRPGVDGDRRCQGVLSEADDDGFRVDERRFAYSDVERVHTVFEWGPAPRPGKNRAAKTPGGPSKGPVSATDQTSNQKASVS
jgi:ribosome maturation factor RimP